MGPVHRRKPAQTSQRPTGSEAALWVPKPGLTTVSDQDWSSAGGSASSQQDLYGMTAPETREAQVRHRLPQLLLVLGHPESSTSQAGPSCSQVESSQHHPAGSPAPSHAIHQLPGPFDATTKSSLGKHCHASCQAVHKDHEETGHTGSMSVWH